MHKIKDRQTAWQTVGVSIRNSSQPCCFFVYILKKYRNLRKWIDNFLQKAMREIGENSDNR